MITVTFVEVLNVPVIRDRLDIVSVLSRSWYSKETSSLKMVLFGALLATQIRKVGFGQDNKQVSPYV